MIKAILFDLWDTLAYFEDLKELHEEEKRRFGLVGYEKLREIFIQAHKEPVTGEEFVDRVQKDILLTDDDRAFVKDAYIHTKPRYYLYPDTVSTLRWLKEQGYNLGLVSNCTLPTEYILETFDIASYFDAIILSHNARCVKPSKEIFDLALKDLRVNPTETVMIGDKVAKDMDGAKNAGIRGILIDREGSIEFPEKIKELQDLKHMLTSVSA